MREGWRRVRLKEVARLDLDQVPVRPGNAYAIAGVWNAGQGLFARSTIKGSETTYQTLHRLRAGQLVMRKLTAWEGTITTVSPEFAGCFVSPEFPTYTLAPGLQPGFMRLVCQRKELWEALRDVSTGTVQRRKRVNPRRLLEIEIDLPPVAVQRRIADVLAAIDAVTAEATRLASQADIAVSSTRREVLESVPNRVRLADALRLHRGYDLPAQDRREGSVLVIASGGPVGTHDAAMVRGPGVVTGRSGTIGRVFMVGDDFWPLNTTLFVEDFKRNDPRFVRHLLIDLRLERFAGGSTVPSLNRNVLDSELVAVPTIERQGQVAALLDALEREAECARGIAARTAELRRALLADLLSGDHEIPSSYDRFLDGAA